MSEISALQISLDLEAFLNLKNSNIRTPTSRQKLEEKSASYTQAYTLVITWSIYQMLKLLKYN